MEQEQGQQELNPRYSYKVANYSVYDGLSQMTLWIQLYAFPDSKASEYSVRLTKPKLDAPLFSGSLHSLFELILLGKLCKEQLEALVKVYEQDELGREQSEEEERKQVELEAIAMDY